jgi:putative membrane protein
MNNNDYQFWGMHLLWWVILLVLLFWIFATPYDIPGQRTKKDSPLGILKKRYALGEINEEEFNAMKKTLESN